MEKKHDKRGEGEGDMWKGGRVEERRKQMNCDRDDQIERDGRESEKREREREREIV